MNQLYPIIRRKRRPLIVENPEAAKAEIGKSESGSESAGVTRDVEPVNAVPVVAMPAVETVNAAPVVVTPAVQPVKKSRPKKAREQASQN